MFVESPATWGAIPDEQHPEPAAVPPPQPIGKVTDYGQASDPYKDTASRNRIGAWDNTLHQNSLAISPDIEARFSQAGIKPDDWVDLQLADGSTVRKQWSDRTMQDKEAETEFGRPLRGRFDFFSPSGPASQRDSAVIGFQKADQTEEGPAAWGAIPEQDMPPSQSVTASGTGGGSPADWGAVPEEPAAPASKASSPADWGAIQELSLWEKTKRRFGEGQEQAAADQLAFQASTGAVPWEDVRKDILHGRNAGSPETKGNWWLPESFLQAVQMMPAMLGGVAEGVKSGAAGAAGAAAVTAIAGQAGPQVALPEELITVPVAARMGWGVGQAYGSSKYWFQQGAGAMYGDLREEGIPHNVASVVSRAAAVPYAAIEYSQVTKLIPGMRHAASQAVAQTLKRRLAELAKEKGREYVEQIGQEVAQELVGVAQESLAETVAHKQPPAGKQSTWQRIWETAKQTALSVPWLMLPSAGVDVVHETRKPGEPPAEPPPLHVEAPTVTPEQEALFTPATTQTEAPPEVSAAMPPVQREPTTRERWLEEQTKAGQAMSEFYRQEQAAAEAAAPEEEVPGEKPVLPEFLQAVIDAGGVPTGQSPNAGGFHDELRMLDRSMRAATKGQLVRGVFNPNAGTPEQLLERLRNQGHEVAGVEDLFTRIHEGVWQSQEPPVDAPFRATEIPSGWMQIEGAAPLAVAEAQKVADTMTSRWDNAPRVQVVESADQIPDGSLRSQVLQASGVVEAAYSPSTQTVTIIARNVMPLEAPDGTRQTAAQRVEQLVLHEAVGHHGLRSLFTGRYAGQWKEISRSIYERIPPQEAARLAKLYKFDMETAAGKYRLVDEWLSRRAEKGETAKWYHEAIAKIRAMLRERFPGLQWSEAEIKALLSAARREVIGSGDAGRNTSESVVVADDKTRSAGVSTAPSGGDRGAVGRPGGRLPEAATRAAETVLRGSRGAFAHLGVEQQATGGTRIRAYPTGNGRIVVRLDAEALAATALRETDGDVQSAIHWMADGVREELIHAAWFESLRRRWMAEGGQAQGRFDAWVETAASRLSNDLVALIDDARAKGDEAMAARVSETVASAWRSYHPDEPPSSESEILGRVRSSADAQWTLSTELIRQLVQIRNSEIGATTETTWRTLFKQIAGWLKDALDTLRRAATGLEKGSLGDSMRRAVQETEALLREVNEQPPESGASFSQAPSQEEAEAAAPEPEKRRKFIQSVKDSAAVRPEVKDLVESVYTVLHNKDTVAAARARINELGLDRAYDAVLDTGKANPPTALSNAMALDLIGRFQAMGLFDRAARIVEHTATQSTAQGQAIQVLSLLGRLTPEGVQMYAQRVINQAVAADPKLTEALAEIQRLRDALEKARKAHGTDSVLAIDDMLKSLGLDTDRLTQLRLRLREILMQSGELPGIARDRLVGLIMGAGIDRAKATKMAERALREYGKQAKRFRQRQIEQMLKVKLKSRPIPKGELEKWRVLNETGALDDAALYERIAKARGLPVFTHGMAMQIKGLQEAYQRAPDGPVKLTKGVEMLERLHEMIPATFSQKARTWQVLMLLLNLKTGIRNVVGNVVQLAGNVTADAVSAVTTDPMVSIFTGRTTSAGPKLAARAEGLKAPAQDFQAGYDYARREGLPMLRWGGWHGGVPTVTGAFREGVQTMMAMGKLTSGGKFDLNQVTNLQRHIFSNGFMRMLEDSLALTLGAPDRAFHQAAYLASLQRQMDAGRRGAVSYVAPTREMHEVAAFEAARAIYQSDTFLSKSAQMVARGLNLASTFGRTDTFGLGSAVLTFSKVPSNIILEATRWTPIGFIQTLYGTLRPSVKGMGQQELVDGLTRAMLGTGGAMFVGYWLARIGVLSAAPDDDRDLEAMRRSGGLGGYKINLSGFKRAMLSGNWWTHQPAQPGDVMMSYNWLQPAAIPVAGGAQIAAEQMKEAPESGHDLGRLALAAAVGGVKSLEDLPLLSGLARYADQISHKGGFLAGTAATLAQIPESMMPTLMRQIREKADNTLRETRAGGDPQQMASRIIEDIPGVSLRFPARYDTFGQAIERYQYGRNTLFNVFVNPATFSQVKQNPLAAELERVYAATGEKGVLPPGRTAKVQVNGKELQLTNEQASEYQRYTGRLAIDIFSQVMAAPGFARLPDPAKASILIGILGDVNTAAKIELFGAKPFSVGTLSGTVSIDKRPLIFRLRARARGIYPERQ